MQNTKIINAQINKILGLQINNKILFLAKYPDTHERKDGFFQRVLRVDLIFKDYLRIYLNIQRTKPEFNIIQINDRCYQINLSPEMEINEDLLKFFALSVSIVYAHSIYSINNKISQILFANSHNAVWDVHGAVPEEVGCLSKANNIFFTKRISSTELFAYSNSKLIIGVSNKLIQHLKQKYAMCEKHPITLLMPIFTGEFNEDLLKKMIVKKPVVIYSGGTQVWQLVPQMLQYVHENKNIYDFIFLVPDPINIMKLYSRLFNGEVFPGVLKSVDPEEVFQYYKMTHFGLVFREDNIINNVACPTKLIEYLANGIIPIVNSRNIGDFNDLGYITLNYKDKILLSEVEFNKIININFQLIKQLHSKIELAKNELQRLAQEVTDNANFLLAVLAYFKLSQEFLILKNSKVWNVVFNKSIQLLRKLRNLFKSTI